MARWSKPKKPFCAVVGGGLAATVVVQQQAQGKLHGENDALRRQVAGLAADLGSLSNHVAQASAAAAMPDDPNEFWKARLNAHAARNDCLALTA